MQIPKFPVCFALIIHVCYPGEWLFLAVLAEAICAQVSVAVIRAAVVPAGKRDCRVREIWRVTKCLETL